MSGCPFSWTGLVTVTLAVLVLNCLTEEYDGKLLSILPLDDAEIYKLADNVCFDLYFNDISSNECQRSFFGRELLNEENPPDPTIFCQDAETVALKVRPHAHLYQLLVLIPDDSDAIIKHILIDPNSTIASISMKQTKYEVYATVLGEKGDPGYWQSGLTLDPQHHNNTENVSKEIEIIQVEDFVYSDTDLRNASIGVTFRWDSFMNECEFTVLNKCHSTVQGHVQFKNIKAKDNRSIILKDLPLDDECTLMVIGGIRNGTLHYRTPPRIINPNVSCVSELLRDMAVSTRRSADGMGSDVMIYWQPPRCPPPSYFLSLAYTHVINMSAPGNVTRFTFPGVVGTGMFEVTLVALYEGSSSFSSSLGYLCDEKISLIIPGAWGGAILLTVIGALLACVRFRIMYFYSISKVRSHHSEVLATQTLALLADAWEVQPDCLKLFEVIGEGAFGIVRRGTLTTQNVAVKMLKEFPSVDEVRSFHTEMELMKSVGRHKNVVNLVGCCSHNRLCIVTEYCSRGDLLNYLRCAQELIVSEDNAMYYRNTEYSTIYKDMFKERHSKLTINKTYDVQDICDSALTSEDLISFCRQIALGMDFLAANHVVHRDLAARNILVCADKTLKIADFGLSRDIYQDSLYQQKDGGKLPIKWLALESLTDRVYTTQSDVWSFGIVMWELMTLGLTPYPDISNSKVLRLLRSGYRMPKPINCSEVLYDVMVTCWNEDPQERLSFSELYVILDKQLQNTTVTEYVTLQLQNENFDTTKQFNYKALLARTKLGRWAIGDKYDHPVKDKEKQCFSADSFKIQILSTS